MLRPYGLLALLFGFAMPVCAEDLPFDLEAGNIAYDVSGSSITATDGVQITGQQGRLRADKVSYDMKANKVLAEGNVVYTDAANENALFVDRMELNGALKDAVASDLRLRVPNLGEIMQAREAVRGEDGVYTFRDVTYSPCKTCFQKRKPWTIHAKNVAYDPSASDVTYKHAWMDVYGVPVMYLPYFSHPIGPKRPHNGLLPPTFGSSTNLGDSVTMGYYIWDEKNNADYTLKGRFMSSRGFQTQVERRQVTLETDSEIKASFINDTATGKVRSHGAFEGEYTLQQGRRLGLNAEVASDDTYLDQFFGRTDPYLDSTLYGEDASTDHYMSLAATHYQDLDVTRDPGKTAHTLPHLQMEKLFAWDNGNQLLMNFDTLNLQRAEGTRYRRMIGEADFSKPMMFGDGSKIEMGGSLRVDAYNIDGLANGKSWSSRTLPEATLAWEKPYISPGGTHTIAPRVMGAISPHGGNPQEIPNEDSVAYELDVSNIFEPNRFAGLDRVETGPRLIYGVDNRWGTPDVTRWRLFLGQSIRKFDDVNLPQSGGASHNISDWVGYAEAAPVDWLGFTQRFRLDYADLKPRRSDTGLRLGEKEYGELRLGHTFLNNGPEELNAEAELPLTDDVKFIGRYRNDLADSRTLLAEGGLEFLRDCYKVEFITRRRGYINGDVRPSTDYLVNIQLLTLGDPGN